MKFTLSWLRTHLDTDASLQQITDRLTGIGLELEGITDPGAALAPFRVAHVLTAEQHPNADRLRACTVDAGEGPVSVVCGAPNARAGIKVVFAPPGAFIPGTGITLKVGEIRGVTSAGMLLSLREMGLGESHDGILELPDDAPVGTPYSDYAGLNDPVIEIAVTPNRGDALSIRGIARDLAASGLGTLRPWAPAPVEGRFDSPVTWAIETDACSWVLGRTVRNVTNGPSPDWLQARLLAIGLRPINALVDVTNFFCFDLGRPLHVFDADRISGGVLTLRPGAGEAFVALNGKTYTADPADCVIADAAGVQSLAGVMGGEATGCTEATTSVFIECALFNPVAVALTGRRHQVSSDARQRFERGIDPALLPAALDAATAMIQQLCGGEASTVAAAGAEPAWQRTATLGFDRLATLGGAEVPADEAVAALARLGFTETARTDQAVTVAVPSWRNDIAAPIVLDPSRTLPADRLAKLQAAVAVAEPEADLVEEVLRLRGLDSIPPVSLPALSAVPAATLTPRQVRAAVARRTLAAAGLLECVSFSFMDHQSAARFGGDEPGLRLLNPIAADLDQMRPTPVATLVQAAARNAARGLPDSLLFEAGPAFSAAGQEVVAGGLLAGHTPRHPSRPSRPFGAMDAKDMAMTVLAGLGLPMDSLSVTADAPGWYHPGQSGVVRQGPKLVLASFGALHPAVTAALSLNGPAAAFEVFLDRVPEPKRRKRATTDFPSLQPVRRDFAFLVPVAAPAESLLRAARGAERTLITEARLFDVFQGGALPPEQKSIGIEVVFQPRERTLTDAEIEAAAAKVVAAVAKATGASLR
ncbi:MAG: phenylalanine--tRNA ligase subunit beta [Janthinobacterium lividum]